QCTFVATCNEDVIHPFLNEALRRRYVHRSRKRIVGRLRQARLAWPGHTHPQKIQNPRFCKHLQQFLELWLSVRSFSPNRATGPTLNRRRPTPINLPHDPFCPSDRIGYGTDRGRNLCLTAVLSKPPCS